MQLIFRVDAAGFSRDVMANQRNVAGLRRCDDVGLACDSSSSGSLRRSSSGSLRNMCWETEARGEIA